MLIARLAGDYQYGRWLFTWLSLVMSLMVSFCAVLFPQDVLDEIWDLIESVSGVCVWRGGGGVLPTLAISVSHHICFILVLILISMFLR